jgi:hypothetical protein
MDISKYINIKNYNLGEIISSLILDLYKENKYKNILFVRTCTTGGWLDDLLIDNKDIDRILYYTDKIKNPSKYHNLTHVIHTNYFNKKLKLLKKNFDLICIDTWHEYEISSRDFRILSSFLNESGILISHDCYPWNKTVANPSYIEGSWCGETYLSFVEFAYNNPNIYYTILNIDTGIGIASKKKLDFLSNKLDRVKQEHLLCLHKKSRDAYTYFIENSKDIINAISS